MDEIFEQQEPPADFTLESESARSEEAAEQGMTERVTGEAVELVPDLQADGQADGDDDDAVDPEDDGSDLDPAI